MAEPFTSGISVQFDLLMSSTLSRDLLQNIWNKASKLVSTSSTAMAPAPGHPPEPRTVVQSTSQTGFHLVTPGSNGKFSCDCKLSIIKLVLSCCSVAEINHKLTTFLEWFKNTIGHRLMSLSFS